MSFALLTNIALYLEFQSATTFLKNEAMSIIWYQNTQKDVVYRAKDTKTQKKRISNFS